MQLPTSIAATILSLATTSLSAPTSYESTLKWQKCPTSLVASNVTIQCGYMEVPMDWDNPDDGKKVTIGMVKLPARKPASKIGTIFYNPGGPGEKPSYDLSGYASEGLASFIRPELLDNFDIIGPDLRGTGLSNPIACSAKIANNGPTFSYPTTNAAFEEIVKYNRAFRQSCIDMTGPLIHYMDTISIAKDFEAIRKAIEEENLSWVATSYGTQLATQYAELFPENIRAMVLDGCSSLSPSTTMSYTLGASDSDVVLKAFFTWCEQQNSTYCPLNNRSQSVEDIWTDLMRKADRNPIPVPVCAEAGVACKKSTLNANDIRIPVYHLLYDYAELPVLATYLSQTYFQNNASGFAPYSITNDESRYDISDSYAQPIISCADRYGDSDVTYEKFKERYAKSETLLMFGIQAVSEFQFNCIGSPPPKRNPPHVISIPETPKMENIFMTNNLFDPATPYGGAENLQQEIGDRAVLVTRNAIGHSMFLKPDAFHGPTMDALVKYLLTGEVPAPGTIYQN